MATTCKLIAKVTLGSNAANIEFTSIPATYTDLLLVVSLRTARSATEDEVHIQFNSDTGNNYSARTLRGSGSVADSLSNATTNAIKRMYMCAASNTASTFGNAEVYIPNYAGSTNKSLSISSVMETNATQAWSVGIAGLWASTSAITSIKLFSETSNNLVSGSSAYLYGITKA